MGRAPACTRGAVLSVSSFSFEGVLNEGMLKAQPGSFFAVPSFAVLEEVSCQPPPRTHMSTPDVARETGGGGCACMQIDRLTFLELEPNGEANQDDVLDVL